MFKKPLAYMLIIAVAFIGCSEERAQKQAQNKEEVRSKASVSPDELFLFVPSTAQVSRTTTVGFPYYQGDPRVVKLKFEKEFLTVLAVDRDERFQDNDINARPIFRIPITHVDYREETDAFGEKINVEVENGYLDWKDKKFFKAKAKEFLFADSNTLPGEIERAYGVDCAQKISQREVDFKVEPDAINIVIERSFRSSLLCESNVNSAEDFLNLTWNEVTHYSLVKLKTIASPEYKPFDYHPDWINTFGFFEVNDQLIDGANNQTQAEKKIYVKRWNPKRKVIKYHMDHRFGKSINASLRGATIESFRRLNIALREAGTDLTLELALGDESMRPGDIRNNMIVLVEDPLANGLLGYGPSVAHPYTGEIVQARTVMYPGVMKRYIRMAYDEILRKTDGVRASVPAATMATASAAMAAASSNKMMRLEAHESMASDLRAMSLAHVNETGHAQYHQNNAISLKADLHKQLMAKEESFKHLDEMDIVGIHAKYNMYTAQEGTFVDISDVLVEEVVNKIGQRTPWDKLSPVQRAQIVDLVLPYVWIPTLIHEVGHNLGLRHNFQGSEDTTNFYSVDELKAKGITSELGSPYASMMEYTKSEITSLRVPGKYDIAALRYGYTETVEAADGTIVDAKGKTPAELSLKEFKYCSDEGVGLNPGCNRFDEGESMVEIAQSMIDAYKERYKLRNFRSGRAKFSIYDERNYTRRMISRFRAMRLFLERTTDIMIENNISQQEVQTNPAYDWLKDLDDATSLIADFFMNVISEPNLTCVVVNTTNNRQEHIGHADLNDYQSKDCFDVRLSSDFVVVGQYGRQLNSSRYFDNPDRYLDQVDVKGVWIDKFIAMWYLTDRTLNSYSLDKVSANFLDNEGTSVKVEKFLKGIMLDEVTTDVEVTLADGTTQILKDHKHSLAKETVRKPLYPYTHWYLGMPFRQTRLSAMLTHTISIGAGDGLSTPETRKFVNSMSKDLNVPLDIPGKDLVSTRISGTPYYARIGSQNIAVELIVKKAAGQEMADFEANQGRDRMIDIYLLLADGKTLEDTVPDVEKDLAKIPVNMLFDHLVGDFPAEEFFNSNLLQMYTHTN